MTPSRCATWRRSWVRCRENRSTSNLATAYHSAGRLDEAIALHEQNLADRRRELGPHHPHTFYSGYNLAEAYVSADRLADAIALYRQTASAAERILGSEHPTTRLVLDGLAQLRGQ